MEFFLSKAIARRGLLSQAPLLQNIDLKISSKRNQIFLAFAYFHINEKI
jgi:hypothetical protein